MCVLEASGSNNAPKVEMKIVDKLEAAARLGGSPRLLQRWRGDGNAPAFVRIGPRRVGYDEATLRQGMQRYGIGPAEWDILRTHGVVTAGGVRVLSPEAVARAAEDGQAQAAPPPRRPAPEASRWDGDGPDALMRLADGSTELGRVPDGIEGAPAEPIRLRRGWHDAAAGKGEGMLHIAAQRQGQLGEPVEEFVARVAASFTAIHRCRDGSLVLSMGDGGRTRDMLAVALGRSADGGWNVITAGRFRQDWLKGKQVLWEAERSSYPSGAGAAPLQRTGQSIQHDITARARLEAATRLLEFVQTEARFAVPEAGVAERSLVLQQLRPGTFVGELWRSALQFKSFPITILLMHGGRGMAQAGIKGKAAYLASFGITATLMGALALRLRDVANGRDPRRMDDHRFWGAAFAQGGGAGLLGDFLYSAVARTDQDFWMQATGGPAEATLAPMPARMTIIAIGRAVATAPEQAPIDRYAARLRQPLGREADHAPGQVGLRRLLYQALPRHHRVGHQESQVQAGSRKPIPHEDRPMATRAAARPLRRHRKAPGQKRRSRRATPHRGKRPPPLSLVRCQGLARPMRERRSILEKMADPIRFERTTSASEASIYPCGRLRAVAEMP
jgi:hypothetical protein